MFRKPDIDNILAVLRKEKPSRPTLFEFYMNEPLYIHLTGQTPRAKDLLDYFRIRALAFAEAGYDYVTLQPVFGFPKVRVERKNTVSLNEGAMITDREEYENYPWPDPDAADYSVLERIAPHLPGNMKIMQGGPGGVLENVIGLIGYDNLCYMVYDDPDLVKDVFEAVGSRLLRYYERSIEYDSVGFLMSNDDWGFKTQTLFSTDFMRTYVFPWHKRIVACAHKAGKPAVLHSCGNLSSVMDDIITDMKFDGKHSFEDGICPVEEIYEQYCGQIAVLGGIDIDFLCKKSTTEIYNRSLDMMRRAEERGGYALGTGNSVPEYVPREAYFAMLSAAFGERYPYFTN